MRAKDCHILSNPVINKTIVTTTIHNNVKITTGKTDRVSILAYGYTFNPLPDVKILGLPKLKAFADDKLNITL